MKLKIGRLPTEVVAGQVIYVQAFVTEDDGSEPRQNNRRNLFFSSSEGTIDKSGKFTAPDISSETDVLIRIEPAASPTDSAEHVVKIKPRPVKSFVKKVEIKKIGKNGKYSLNIQAVNDKGSGVKCKIIMTQEDHSLPGILPGGLTQLQIETNDRGFLTIQLGGFAEKKRVVLVQVESTDVDKRVDLDGPKWNPTLRPGGFLDNLLQR